MKMRRLAWLLCIFLTLSQVAAQTAGVRPGHTLVNPAGASYLVSPLKKKEAKEDHISTWVWNKLTGHGHQAIRTWRHPPLEEDFATVLEADEEELGVEVPGVIYRDKLVDDLRKTEAEIRRLDSLIEDKMRELGKAEEEHEQLTEHKHGESTPEHKKGFFSWIFGKLWRTSENVAEGIGQKVQKAERHAKDRVAKGASKLEHGVENAAESAAEKISSGAHELGEQARRGARRLKEGVENIGEQVAEKISAEKENVKSGAKKITHKTGEALNRIQDEMGELSDRAKETTQEFAKETGSLIMRPFTYFWHWFKQVPSRFFSFFFRKKAEVERITREKAEPIKEQVSEKVQNVATNVRTSAEGMMEEVGDKLSTLKEKAKETGEGAVEIASKVTDTIKEYGEAARKKAAEKLPSGSDLAHICTHPGEELVETIRHFCEDYLDEHPRPSQIAINKRR